MKSIYHPRILQRHFMENTTTIQISQVTLLAPGNAKNNEKITHLYFPTRHFPKLKIQRRIEHSHKKIK